MLTIEEILQRTSFDDLSVEHAIDAIGRMVDHAFDHGNKELTDRVLACCNVLEMRGLSPSQQTLLDYFRANAWANRQVALRNDPAAACAWEQPEVQNQIFYLRRALNSVAFKRLEAIRRCQILTNLANQLDTVGRFVESRVYWTR